MPNWVTCNITFTAESEEEMKLFHEKMTRPRPYAKSDPERPYLNLPYSEENIEYGEKQFSFWNIIQPQDLASYWGEETKLPFAEAIQHKTDHWYDWNVRNWGCKWDASVLTDEGPEGKTWDIMIDTPWSPPVEALESLAEQHPNISVKALCVEEQGWGSVYESLDGLLIESDTWEIPEGHKEYLDTLGKYGYECRCVENAYDEDFLYDDCPRPADKMTLIETATV
jgi:hypothetical protein